MTNEKIQYGSMEWVNIDDIVIDHEQLQMREKINDEVVDKLAGLIRELGGNKMPEHRYPFEPVHIVRVKIFEEINLWLIGGFHRMEAVKRFHDLKKVRAFVSMGTHTMSEALLEAASSNNKNGQFFGREDVKHAIYKLRHLNLTQKILAERFAYSRQTIAKFIREMMREPDKYPLLQYQGFKANNNASDNDSEMLSLNINQKNSNDQEPEEMSFDEVMDDDPSRDKSLDVVSSYDDPDIIVKDGKEYRQGKDGKDYPVSKPSRKIELEPPPLEQFLPPEYEIETSPLAKTQMEDEAKRKQQDWVKAEKARPKEEPVPFSEASDSYTKPERLWMSSLLTCLKSRPNPLSLELAPDSIGVTKNESHLKILWRKSEENAKWREWDWRQHFDFTPSETELLEKAEVITVGQLSEIVAHRRKIEGFGEARVEKLNEQFDRFWETHPALKD